VHRSELGCSCLAIRRKVSRKSTRDLKTAHASGWNKFGKTTALSNISADSSHRFKAAAAPAADLYDPRPAKKAKTDPEDEFVLMASDVVVPSAPGSFWGSSMQGFFGDSMHENEDEFDFDAPFHGFSSTNNNSRATTPFWFTPAALDDDIDSIHNDHSSNNNANMGAPIMVDDDLAIDDGSSSSSNNSSARAHAPREEQMRPFPMPVLPVKRSASTESISATAISSSSSSSTHMNNNNQVDSDEEAGLEQVSSSNHDCAPLPLSHMHEIETSGGISRTEADIVLDMMESYQVRQLNPEEATRLKASGFRNQRKHRKAVLFQEDVQLLLRSKCAHELTQGPHRGIPSRELVAHACKLVVANYAESLAQDDPGCIWSALVVRVCWLLTEAGYSAVVRRGDGKHSEITLYVGTYAISRSNLRKLIVERWTKNQKGQDSP